MSVKGHTLIRVCKSTNDRLLAARELTGKSVSAMAEEAIAAYFDVEVMAARLDRDERRRKILLKQLITP